MNRSSVTRHRRTHLLPSLVEGVTGDPELSALDPLLELRALFSGMKRHLASAEETGNLLAIRMIGGEVRAALELFGRFQAQAQAARSAGQGCETCEKLNATSLEEKRDFLLRHRALNYLQDPAGFLESVRNRAAVEIAERRRIPMIEARAAVEAREAAAAENLKERS